MFQEFDNENHLSIPVLYRELVQNMELHASSRMKVISFGSNPGPFR